jgi:hypothetical protein
MHKQVSSLLSDGASPGELAKYARLLERRGANIRSIGGSEWARRGAVAVLVDDSVNVAELAEGLTEDGYQSREIFCAEAVLADRPGSLADAAEAIGDINILTILVADTHGGAGLVSFGFASQEDADAAKERLGAVVVPEHGLTRAWQAHEDWDRANPNQPPPDPRNP